MQKRFAILLFFSLFAGLFALTAEVSTYAATTLPTKMNFQGRVTNNSGNILANGTYNMKFRIWSASTAGAQLWSEDRLISASQGVVVTNGQFNVQLGSVTSLPASVFASDSVYFEVELPTPASATTSSPVWTEGAMTPRNQFATSAYAYNSETLDGLDSAAFGQLNQNNIFTGNNTFDGTLQGGSSLTLGTSSVQGALVLNDGSGQTGTLAMANSAGSYIYTIPVTTANDTFCMETLANCIGSGGGTLQDAYDGSGSPATITTTAAKGLNIAAGAAPTADLFSVSNTGQATTTANVNGIQVDYVGGAAAVEGAGARIDLTPGTTTAGTWNGMQIVAAGVGAVTGVTENGIKLTGPTSPGAGAEVALNIDANWDAGLQITGKDAEPPTPTGDNIYIYAQKYAGRSMLSQKGASGVAFAYQPAFFEQAISMLQPGTGTAMTAFGTPWTTDTTGSHPAPTEAYGSHANFATAATAADTTGIYQTTAQHFRGSVANGSNGFFSTFRVGMSDASYGTGATGTRVFIGMSNQTTGLVTADSVAAGHYAGFQYSTSRGDTNWMFVHNGNSTHTAVSTGLTFVAAKVYDFYVYTPPQGSTIYWRIDNVTDGTTQSGSVNTFLPGTTTAMRPGVNMATLTTTARNIKVNKVYIETDR